MLTDPRLVRPARAGPRAAPAGAGHGPVGGRGRRGGGSRRLGFGPGLAWGLTLPAGHRKISVVRPNIRAALACLWRLASLTSLGESAAAPRDGLQGLATRGCRPGILPGFSQLLPILQNPVEPAFHPAAQAIKPAQASLERWPPLAALAAPGPGPGTGDAIHQLSAGAHQPIKTLPEGLRPGISHQSNLTATARQPALPAQAHQGDGEPTEFQGPEKNAHAGALLARP